MLEKNIAGNDKVAGGRKSIRSFRIYVPANPYQTTEAKEPLIGQEYLQKGFRILLERRSGLGEVS